MAKSVSDLSRKLTRAGNAIKYQDERAVKAASLAAKPVLIAGAASAGLSPSSKIAGAKWGVWFNVKGTAKPTSLLAYRGPVHLVNNPTRPHRITPRRKRALSIGGDARAGANHPGTKGKNFWPSTKKKAQVVIVTVFKRTIQTGLRRTFTG